jgi:ABC-type multidrug transport system fused ATPase/permease subunit
MSLTFFITIWLKIEEIKPQLLWRPANPYNWSIVGLSACLILLTIARINTPYFVKSITRSIFKNRNVERIVNEDLPIGNLTNFILTTNYLISFTFLIYFNLNQLLKIPNWIEILTACLIPLYLLFSPILYLNIVEIISGEKNITTEIKLTNKIVSQFIGLCSSIILVVWVFNQHLHWFLSSIVIYLVLILYLFRVFRGIVFAFQKSLPWFYIILYFCTFELLPVYIIYNYVSSV